MWTGEELVIWGGASAKGEPLASGARYDPAADRWTELPPSPSKPRRGHVAVWSGSEVLIWGGQFPNSSSSTKEGIAFDPKANTWRTMAESPIPGRIEAQAVWAGREMVLWGGHPPGFAGHGGAEEPGIVAYDPARDSWRTLPDPRSAGGDVPDLSSPAPGVRRLVARTGDELFFLAWDIGTHGEISANVTPLDLSTSRWGRPSGPAPAPPPPPDSVQAVGACSSAPALAAAQHGEWAFVWIGSCVAERGLVYSLEAGTWSTSVDLPQMENVQAVATSENVYLFGAVPSGVDVYEYRPLDNIVRRSDHRDIDIVPSSDAVWTGEEILFFNGSRGIDQPRPTASFRPPA